MDKPDLRRLPNVVKCIKTLKSDFKKGKYYNIKGTYGNPQRAIEVHNINDYVPIDCIHKVVMYTHEYEIYYFNVNGVQDILNLFDYFEIPEFSEGVRKFNI